MKVVKDYKQRVAGSSPAVPTNENKPLTKLKPVGGLLFAAKLYYSDF